MNDFFEQLEQIPKSVVKQVVKLPSDVAAGAIKSVVGSGVDPLTGIEVSTPQRIRQLKKQEAKRKAAAIPHAQQIIAGIKKSQGPQIPKYLAGKPGFNQEQAVKQMAGEALPAKKELPPPVSAAKKKFSTNEKRGGVGG